MNRAGIAAVLSFLLPGLGQMYNGDFFRALLWFTGMWIFSVAMFPLHGGLGTLVFHVWCAWSAYHRALPAARVDEYDRRGRIIDSHWE